MSAAFASVVKSAEIDRIRSPVCGMPALARLSAIVARTTSA